MVIDVSPHDVDVGARLAFPTRPDSRCHADTARRHHAFRVGERHKAILASHRLAARWINPIMHSACTNKNVEQSNRYRYLTSLHDFYPVALCTIYGRQSVIPQRMGAAADRVRVAAGDI